MLDIIKENTKVNFEPSDRFLQIFQVFEEAENGVFPDRSGPYIWFTGYHGGPINCISVSLAYDSRKKRIVVTLMRFIREYIKEFPITKFKDAESLAIKTRNSVEYSELSFEEIVNKFGYKVLRGR